MRTVKIDQGGMETSLKRDNHKYKEIKFPSGDFMTTPNLVAVPLTDLMAATPDLLAPSGELLSTQIDYIMIDHVMNMQVDQNMTTQINPVLKTWIDLKMTTQIHPIMTMQVDHIMTSQIDPIMIT